MDFLQLYRPKIYNGSPRKFSKIQVWIKYQFHGKKLDLLRSEINHGFTSIDMRWNVLKQHLPYKSLDWAKLF